MSCLQDSEFEYDPDGKKEQVAVIMRGVVYKESGLKNSNHSEVEGKLYDQLCSFPRYKLRDEVRKMAHSNAIIAKDKEFIPTVQWLDNFMRRFCLSRKKMGMSSSKILNLKIKGSKATSISNNDVELSENNKDDSQNSATEVNKTNNTSEIIANPQSDSELPCTGNSADTVLFTKDIVDGDDKDITEKPSLKKGEGLKLVSFDKLIDPSMFTPKRCQDPPAASDISFGNNKKVVTINLDQSEASKGDASWNEDIVEISDDESETNDSSSGKETESNDDHEVNKKADWESLNATDYTEKEDKYYLENISALQRRLEIKVTQCTACFAQVNHVSNTEVFTHPDLGVLLCKKCHKFYGKGIFKKDDDGYDEYCRWCANGGDLYLCDKCHNGFCKQCVKRNVGRAAVRNAENCKSWICYVCNPAPILECRMYHRVILDGLRSKELLQEGLSRTQVNKILIEDKFAALKVKRAVKNLSPKKDFVTSKNGAPISKKGTNGEDVKLEKKTFDFKEDTQSTKRREDNHQSHDMIEEMVSSSSEVNNHTDNDNWINTCLNNILELLSACSSKVKGLSKKNNRATKEEKIKIKNKLIKVSKVMIDNFTEVEKFIAEQSGTKIVDYTQSNSLTKKNKRHISVKKSPIKRSPLKKRTPQKKVVDSDSEDDQNDVPKRTPKRKSPLKKRKRISVSSEEDVNSSSRRKRCASDNEEVESLQNSDRINNDKDTESDITKFLKSNRDNATSNEGSGKDRESSNDRASSKNPNGSVDEGFDLDHIHEHQNVLPQALSPIHVHKDSEVDNENSVDEEEVEHSNISEKNNVDELENDTVQSSSLSSSNKQCSESLLNGLQGTTEVIFEKENSEAVSECNENATTITAKEPQKKNDKTKESLFTNIVESKESDLEDSCTQMTEKNSDLLDNSLSEKTKKTHNVEPKLANLELKSSEISDTESTNSLSSKDLVKRNKTDEAASEKLENIPDEESLSKPYNESKSLPPKSKELKTNLQEDPDELTSSKAESIVQLELKNDSAKRCLLASDSDGSDGDISDSFIKIKGNDNEKLKSIALKTDQETFLKESDNEGCISEKNNIFMDSCESDDDLTSHSKITNKKGDKKANKKNSKVENYNLKKEDYEKETNPEIIAKKSLLASDSDESELGCEVTSRTSSSKSVARKSTSKSRHKRVSDRKKLKRKYLPSPKSIKDDKKKRQLANGLVKILTLDSKISSDLKKFGYISVKKYPYLMEKSLHESDNLALDSEEEFESLLRFKGIKKTRSKENSTEPSTEDPSDGEEDIQSEKEDLSEKTERKNVKKRKKEGLMDISLNADGENEENENDENNDNDDDKELSKSDIINDQIKKALLLSSDEDDADDSKSDCEDNGLLDKVICEQMEEDKRKKYDLKKMKQEELKKKEEEASNDNDEESEEEKICSKSKKFGKFSLNFSSDEDDNKDEGGDDAEEEEEEEEDDDENDDGEDISPRKKRMFVDSDSDFEIFEKKGSKTKKSVFESSNDESEDSDQNSKRKAKSRKRIKKASSSDEDVVACDDESPSKKRRRRIIRDEDLLQSTKDAAQEEQERVNRLKEKQKLYNKIFDMTDGSHNEKLDSLVLDFDEKSSDKKVFASVNEKLLSFLKPHQAVGIQFMYNATIDSVIEMDNNKKGSGCILAHCMGLGKTLQVIAMVHTLLTNKRIHKHIEKVMVCCPVNTVYNWEQEFRKWLKGSLKNDISVVELISAKNLWARAYRLDDWYKEGGVCIIGYDMFRNLSNANNKKYKGQMRTIFQKALVDPGPDFIVCDEGHILKNEKTALSISINKIKTARRVVLTGTPLQNNLKEYHCMIQFVKPNLLGTKKEFMNRFVNPITAGQCNDAIPRDVRRMKRRAHILHKLLEGCVQRFDYTVLKPFLPPKFEYVVSVQLTDVQCKLYEYYLRNLAQGGPKRNGSGLFVDFNNLSRIWSHPAVLYLALQRRLLQPSAEDELDEDDGDLEGFIDDEDCSDSSEDERAKRRKKRKKAASEDDVLDEEIEKIKDENPEAVESNIPGLNNEGKVKTDWWRAELQSIVGESYDEDVFLNRIDISGKLYLLLDILRECATIGDKVLLFSQSILALDMIENFLKMLDEGELEMPGGNEKLQFTQWKLNKDYLRLDGSIGADIRKDQCEKFNKVDNERCRLFLISTRAGGVGINLVAANRVIIFDSSWNPSHDTQSIFRVYRFGQKKPCYIYRFVAQGTMEEKIYSRQVTKISTSLRVVDEHQIKRYFNMAELAELYEFNPANSEEREMPKVPEDRLLAEMLIRNKKYIVNYHEHDSLLENQTEEELSKEEREAAWADYENEKKGLIQQPAYNMANFNTPIQPFDANAIMTSICLQQPNITQVQLQQSLILATQQIQTAHVRLYQTFNTHLYKVKDPKTTQDVLRLFPDYTQSDLVAMFDSQNAILINNIKLESIFIDKIKNSSSFGSSMSLENLQAAGLARGMPSVSGVQSNTLKYVARNYTKNPTTSLVNTNFKTMVRPPSKYSIVPSKPDVPMVSISSVKKNGKSSASTTTGAQDKDLNKSGDVILLE